MFTEIRDVAALRASSISAERNSAIAAVTSFGDVDSLASTCSDEGLDIDYEGSNRRRCQNYEKGRLDLTDW